VLQLDNILASDETDPMATRKTSKPEAQPTPPGSSRSEPSSSVPLEGVALVEKATQIVQSYPGRPKDSKGRPGGLIDFPANLRPIIVGDLHTDMNNLHNILDHETNRQDVEANKAAYIVVGDAVHSDQTGQMKDMTSSLAILEELFRLIIAYPRNFIYMRGNHDTFDERLVKSGIAQGKEFKKKVVEARSPEYAAAVERFFDELPYFIIGDGFVITHAGPPRGGCTREQLIDVRDRPDLMQQLTWNRINEFHGTPSSREYGERDVRAMLECLYLPEFTHFIVGHNIINDGSKTGCWMNVIGVRNHHIIYSGTSSQAPYLTFQGKEIVLKLAQVKSAEVYYYG
jgi:hypothetical protein